MIAREGYRCRWLATGFYCKSAGNYTNAEESRRRAEGPCESSLLVRLGGIR